VSAIVSRRLASTETSKTFIEQELYPPGLDRPDFSLPAPDIPDIRTG
jgi:hypothetical protein